MKKFSVILILIIGYYKTYSQVKDLEIVTIKNDTLKNIELKMSFLFKSELNTKLQKELIFIKKSGEKSVLLPFEVISFSFKYNDEIYKYESVDGKLFAQLMYENKVKLLRFIKPTYTSINIYIVKRPNNPKILFMEAMGLSRLISKKVISREMIDCPVTLSKVENKLLKIQGEKGVLELIKDYENNCL